MSVMSLAEARLQLNMPFASETEVLNAALKNNIQIIDLNLGGIQNTANLNDLNNNLGGSLFGASTTSQASYNELMFGKGASSSQPSLNFSINGSESGIYGDMGVSFSNKSIAQLEKPIEIKEKPALTKDNSGNAVSVDSILQNPKLAEIRVINGKVVAYDKSGNELTDENGLPIDIDANSLSQDISSIKFENGKVIIEKSDGKTISRRARLGEQGFNEKGENFDHRLQRYFGISSDKYLQLSDEQKKEYSKKYQQGIRKEAYNRAIEQGKSDAEARKIAHNAVIHDFRALCRRSGKSPEEMKGIAMTLYGMDPKVAEQEVQKYMNESITTADAETFATGILDNIDLADKPEMQTSVVKSVADAAKTTGISDKVAVSIGRAIVENKFHGKEATIEALRTQYGLSAEQANEYYANLPEEVRQKIEDETLDAISTVQTEVAADETQSEDVRHNAADLSTEYMTYIDDAEYQMQVIQNNSNYILQNADDEMKEYYNNSIANNAYNYDISNREDIIRMVKELGTEKTLEILENARKEYEAQDADNKAATEFLKEANAQKDEAAQQTQQRQSSQQTEQTQKTQSKVTRTTVQQVSTEEPKQSFADRLAKSGSFGPLTPVQSYVMSDEFKTADIHTKQEYISKLNASDKKQAVATLVETSTPAQLTAYMYSGLKKNILSYLVNNPGGKNTETLKYLSGFLSGPDKQYVKELEEDRMKLLGMKHSESTVDYTQQRRNPFNIEA